MAVSIAVAHVIPVNWGISDLSGLFLPVFEATLRGVSLPISPFYFIHFFPERKGPHICPNLLNVVGAFLFGPNFAN
jgi:hypothetical protein